MFFYSFHEDKGGVSEFIQVLERDAYRSPLILIWKAKDWSSVISSEVSFTDKASMFWLRFSILVVPGMGHTSSPCWWTHASASCAGVHPFFAAISVTRSNMSLLCSIFSGLNRGKDWSRKAQRNQHGASHQYSLSTRKKIMWNSFRHCCLSVIFIPVACPPSWSCLQSWVRKRESLVLKDYMPRFQSQVP